MKYFSDCHFHALTLAEPDFSAFLSSLYDSASGLLAANAAPGYIITPQLMKGTAFLDTISNALMAFTRPIDEIFMMMEDDLEGLYTSDEKHIYAPILPYIHDGTIHIRGLEAEKMLAMPLLIDFSSPFRSSGKTYYTAKAEDRITPYVKATIRGIQEYYRKRPAGRFEFYPFLGINPVMHSQSFMENLITRYINTSHTMHIDHKLPRKPFYGIKVYPPLFFSPWPEDDETLEKHRWLYSFCDKNRVPIITHADDQGFRGTTAEESWKRTDPEAWRPVLENYPDLIISFAHFGKQYSLASRHSVRSFSQRYSHHPDSPWFYSIISLMKEYPGVYADLSFSGCTPEFYSSLCNYLEEEKERERIISRILFGSDFSVNLLKVESYTEYFSIFEHSAFTDSEIEKILSENILRFMGF